MSSSDDNKLEDRSDADVHIHHTHHTELSSISRDQGLQFISVVDNDLGPAIVGQTPFTEVTAASLEHSAVLEEPKQDLEPVLAKLSIACHLGVFGIIGVLIRFSMELLFGQSVGDVTDNNQVVFTDLPANMLGCFLMGIIGVRLKPEFNRFSSVLTLGLTTGLTGSITTYASWNQRMLIFLTNHLFARAIFGFFLGMLVSQMCLLVGIDAGSGIQSVYESRPNWLRWKCYDWLEPPPPDNYYRKRNFMVLFSAMFGLFWALALIASVADTHHLVRRRLWLACVFGPFGVWTRYLLSALNGLGFGPKKVLSWLPLGTLAANIIACYIEAGLNLATTIHPEDEFLVLSGALQLGLCGCMSTVSSFVTEVYQLHHTKQPGRAYAYVVISLCLSSVGSILVFSVPSWVLNKHAAYNYGKGH